MKITILGCGSSTGVPAIGCKCPVCLSPDPKNKRTRVSVMVEQGGKQLLIDTSPDMRMQFLANGFCRADAILYTHPHADHLYGIDDVRSINFQLEAPVKAYMDKETHHIISTRFPYVLKMPDLTYGWHRPCLEPVVVGYDKPFTAAGMEMVLFEQTHGKTTSAGVRIGDFAYCTDTNALSDAAFETLRGVKLWVVDCLRYMPAVSHAHLELTLQWIKRLKPKRAILTHMAHDFDYNVLKGELPEGVEPAYDGMVVIL
jgi:phosphoribosyl 1,2-cyclic phosphate phosphodiesterase